MVLLLALVFIFSGEPGVCLEDDGGFTFDGDIHQFAVAAQTVYVVTEEKLHQLSPDLTLVQSLALRGKSKDGNPGEFYRGSETSQWNTTFHVHVLLPFIANNSLILCGFIDNTCDGYCEVLDMYNIKNVLYSENIQVGQRRRSRSSIAFLVNIERKGTYILTGIETNQRQTDRCNLYNTVSLYNSDNTQSGGIFSVVDHQSAPFLNSYDDVEFVDGFQVKSTIYLLANILLGPRINKVRLIWLEGKNSKTQTLKSVRGVTLVSDDAEGSSRLVASSVIPGEPLVLWSGVFTVDGGQTNTELVVFDITPDPTISAGGDSDFYFGPRPSFWLRLRQPPQKPRAVLLRQNYMTSVLAVRQRAWMIFFIGTSDGQLIKLVVDKKYHTACPTLLYRANDNRPLFPKIHLDQLHHKHVYVVLGNQIKRVPVSKCSTFRTTKECLSSQDPNCVWCHSKRSCTFVDDCKDSDWLSVPEDFHDNIVSYKLQRHNTSQLKLVVHIHLTTNRQMDLSNFTCQFVGTSGEMCKGLQSPQFPQCSCILRNERIPDEDLNFTVKFRLGMMIFTEQLKLNNCSNIRDSQTLHLCEHCLKSGCIWGSNGCTLENEGFRIIVCRHGLKDEDRYCQVVTSNWNDLPPQISSVSPRVVSLYGRNHAVLSGYNLSDVTRVRIQRDAACTAQESPVWNNTGVNLTFHIPSTDYKGVVRVCVVLQDGSCCGNHKITYRSSPFCLRPEPSSAWFSGKRTITIIGSHLEFVEGVIHSHNPHETALPTSSNSGNLTYEAAAARTTHRSFFSSVSLKVANETLVCFSSFKYLPDPEFIGFKSLTTGVDALITLEKKKDELEMTTAELSVWGVRNGKQWPCVMMSKETTDETELFSCRIEKTPNATFQHLMIHYGDRTVTLGPPSLLSQVLLIVRLALIPCVFVVLVTICRWYKKLTAEKDR